jgi:hypothetical protein
MSNPLTTNLKDIINLRNPVEPDDLQTHVFIIDAALVDICKASCRHWVTDERYIFQPETIRIKIGGLR